MGFDKNYKNRKDWRKPYRGSKAFDCTCRNHGSCPWCEGTRTFFDKKKRYFADKELEDYKKGEDL